MQISVREGVCFPFNNTICGFIVTDLELPFHFSPRGPHAVSLLLLLPPPLRLQQPNIKQKFVALLKRFKVTDEVRPFSSGVFF